MGIDTVAVFTSVDAGEPHVVEAGAAVEVDGYLDADQLVAAAQASGADAVHPGYGFLSENPAFARLVESAGLVWVGPPAEAIEVMGSKLASKEAVVAAGVAALPSTDLTGLSESEAEVAAGELGYPVLVKASAGGGGKGMRLVDGPAGLTEAIAGARRESEAAFGDGTVFLEKWLAEPRHVEIQVFGDRDGRLISLFERECSIQRRHQKIVEEAPSPVVDQDLRTEMGRSAVRAAGAVGYVGAGTVEFLLADRDFFFLEMNTRLQVEHPVTEMVTGLDLVRLQIEVASGMPLDFEPRLEGHAIEARLYAEDAANGFLPVTGNVQRFRFPDLTELRVDSGVEAGSRVGTEYDPLLAKVIAYAPSREQAAALLARALRRAQIHGITTNRALLARILEHSEFLAGQTDTGFLDRHDPADLGRPLVDIEGEEMAAVAGALADRAFDHTRSPVLRTIPPGWRNDGGTVEERGYRGELGTHSISYVSNPQALIDRPIDILSTFPDRVELAVGGESIVFAVTRYGEIRYVDSPLGEVRLEAVPRFATAEAAEVPGSLRVPMPGRVSRVEVAPGDRVGAGQPLLVLEAMKMEHTIRAPEEGTVESVEVATGQQVAAGKVVVVLSVQQAGSAAAPGK